MTLLWHLLAHAPHLRHYMHLHPHTAHHLARVIADYPERMRYLLHHEHYRQWLLGYLRSHHRLPSIDLLLGA